MAHTTDHAHFMSLALEQAQNALLISRPNPAVGCVLVKANKVVGTGFTQEAGSHHAEVMAINAAAAAATGATAYVTLEPCSHYGQTPPCSLALINANIKRVVYGCQDANPKVAGQGLAQLKAAGIEVIGPVMQTECEAINAGFLQRVKTNKPHIINKMAMSLDGRTAMESGESQWITGPKARAQVHLLRATSCAVVTGVGSVLRDNPSMNARADELSSAGVADALIKRLQQPLRVILDSQLRTPVSAKLFQHPGQVLIITGEQDAKRHEPFKALGAQVKVSALNKHGKLDLAAVMSLLGQRQCNQVLVEAGAGLSGAFLEAGLTDHLIIFMAPKLLGSSARPLFNLPLEKMAEAYALNISNISPIGSDWRIDATSKAPDR